MLGRSLAGEKGNEAVGVKAGGSSCREVGVWGLVGGEGSSLLLAWLDFETTSL